MQTNFGMLKGFAFALCLVLVFAWDTVWASQSYSGSVVVQKKSGKTHTIGLIKGKNRVEVIIPARSLDDYMTEEGIDEVTITVDLEEMKIVDIGGVAFYTLKFVFGPSGGYFAPEDLRLMIRGKYIKHGTAIWLFDENGEMVEGTMHKTADKVVFYIPHFSSYYYEDYNY